MDLPWALPAPHLLSCVTWAGSVLLHKMGTVAPFLAHASGAGLASGKGPWADRLYYPQVQ